MKLSNRGLVDFFVNDAGTGLNDGSMFGSGEKDTTV